MPPTFLHPIGVQGGVPRISVWLPDELAEQARAAALNVSALTQQAIRRELAMRGELTDQLMADLDSSLSPKADRQAVRARLDETLRGLLD